MTTLIKLLDKDEKIYSNLLNNIDSLKTLGEEILKENIKIYSIYNNNITVHLKECKFFCNNTIDDICCEYSPIPYSDCISFISTKKINLLKIKFQYIFNVKKYTNKGCKFYIPDYSNWKFTKKAKNKFEKSLKEMILHEIKEDLDFYFDKKSYKPDWLDTILLFS